MCPVCREAGKTRFSVALSVIATSRLPKPCLKTGNRSQTVVRRACGNSLYTKDPWPFLSTPSHSLTPLPWPQILSLESGLKNKTSWPSPARPSLTKPSTIDTALWDLFEPAMKNRWESEEKNERSRRAGGGKKGSLVKYFRRKITQRGCLIISICLVWFCWGGHVVSVTAPRFIFHIIWSWMESKKKRVGLGWGGGQFGVSLGGLWWGGWTLWAKCSKGLWDPEGFMSLIGSLSSKS